MQYGFVCAREAQDEVIIDENRMYDSKKIPLSVHQLHKSVNNGSALSLTTTIPYIASLTPNDAILHLFNIENPDKTVL